MKKRLLIFLFLIPEVLLAQNPITLRKSIVDSLFKLNEVIVVGDIGVTKIKPQVIKYAVKDLPSQVGGTAGDILKNMPSVAMGGSPNHNRDIRFRGFGNGYTQVLIDGKATGFSGNNRETVLDLIPANQIESIEIISNPTADMMSQGINGVVNIKLKKTLTENGKINGDVNLFADNYKGYNGGLRLASRLNAFDFGVSYERLERNVDNISRGDQIKTNTSGSITERILTAKSENKNFFNTNARAYMNIHLPKDVKIYTEFVSGSQEEDKPKNETSLTFLADGTFKSGKNPTDVEDKKIYFHNPSVILVKKWENTSLEFGLAANFFGEGKIKNQDEFIANKDGLPDLTKNPKRLRQFEDTDVNVYLPSILISGNLVRKVSYKAGYQGFYTARSTNRITDNFDFAKSTWVNAVDSKNNFSVDENIHSVFFTTNYKIDKFNVDAGYRHEFTDVNSVMASDVNTAGGDYHIALPSLNMSYNITDRSYLTMSAGRRIRRAGYNDLNPFIEVKSATELKVGNPELRPELAWAYELGGFTQFRSFNFGVNVFYRDIKNLIQKTLVLEDNVTTEMLDNVANAYTRGIEFVAAVNPVRWWNLNANYSKFDSRVRSNDQYDGEAIKDQFAWTAKLINDVKLPYKFNAQMTGNWVGPKNSTEEGEGEIFFMDFGLEKQLKSNMFVYLRVADLTDNLGKYKFKNVSNVVQNTYEETQGRIVNLGAKLSF